MHRSVTPSCPKLAASLLVVYRVCLSCRGRTVSCRGASGFPDGLVPRLAWGGGESCERASHGDRYFFVLLSCFSVGAGFNAAHVNGLGFGGLSATPPRSRRGRPIVVCRRLSWCMGGSAHQLSPPFRATLFAGLRGPGLADALLFIRQHRKVAGCGMAPAAASVGKVRPRLSVLRTSAFLSDTPFR